jgi:serine/threonine-protein kinase HipA
MTIGTYGRMASIYNLLSQFERFGLIAEGIKKESDAVIGTSRAWRNHFRASALLPKDIEYIAPAFLPECLFLEKPVEG